MKSVWLAGAVALAMMGAANAEGCEQIPTSREVDALGFYVDNDLCQPECIASVWIYRESNGIAGLQRGDEVHDDTCGGKIPADTLVAEVRA